MRDRYRLGQMTLLPFLSTDKGGGSGNSDPSGSTGGDPQDPQDPNDQQDPPPTEPSNPPEPFAKFPDKESFEARMDRYHRSKADADAQALGYKDHAEMLEAAKQRKAEMAAQESEIDRLKRERDEAVQREQQEASKARQDRLYARVERICSTDDEKIREKVDKIVDPDTAFRLMDQSEIHFADDGSIHGVEDALAKLIADKPYLRVADQAPSHHVPASPKPAESKNQGRYVDRFISGRYLRSE